MPTASTATDVQTIESDFATDWSGLWAIWAIYFSFGLVSGSFAPIITEVRESLLIDAGRMGLLLGLWQFVYFVTSVPISKLIDRIGITWSLAVAGLLIGCSGLLRAVAPNYPVMLLAVVVFGLGGPFISIGAPKFVATTFGARRRARAVSIYIIGPPLGATVAVAATQSLLMPVLGGWRAVLALYGLVALGAAAFWTILRRWQRHRRPETPPETTTQVPRMTTRSLLRSRTMWTLMAFAFATFAVNHALGNWMVELLRSKGFDEAAAGTIASIPVLVGIVAALVIPRVAVGARRTTTIVMVQVIGAVALLALLDPTRWSVALALPLVAIGCLRAAPLPLATLMIMDDRRLGGARSAASIGVYFAAGEFGGLIGPLVAGLLVEGTGSFNLVVWTLWALTVAGAVLGAMASQSTRSHAR